MELNACICAVKFRHISLKVLTKVSNGHFLKGAYNGIEFGTSEAILQ